MLAPILQTTAYIMSPDGRDVLLVHRDKMPDDLHFGKYLGLGGHVEPGEDPVTCIRREIAEESGLAVEAMTLRGSVVWTGFGRRRQDFMCFVFLVTAFSGEPYRGNEEGSLEWVPVDKLASRPMWDSDHRWLPLVFDGDPRQFHGAMPYDGDDMLSWSYQRI